MRRRLPAQMNGVILLMAHCCGHSHRRGTGHCMRKVECTIIILTWLYWVYNFSKSHISFKKQKKDTTNFYQNVPHLSQGLWGAGCCSPSHTSCCHRDGLWTRTCSLSLRGPPESDSWAVSPSLLPSLSWQAAESDTEPQSHLGNEAGLEGIGASKREITTWITRLKYWHFLWNAQLARSYLPL